MTLKGFAEQNGINYQTAKTWFRRGKIREVSKGEFQLSETELKPAETMPCSLETLCEVSKPDPFETSSYALRPAPAETLKPETCAGCEILKLEVSVLRDRVAAFEVDLAELRAGGGNGSQSRSNYAGSRQSVGAAFDDCAAPYESDFSQ